MQRFLAGLLHFVLLFLGLVFAAGVIVALSMIAALLQ